MSVPWARTRASAVRLCAPLGRLFRGIVSIKPTGWVALARLTGRRVERYTVIL